MFIIFHFLFIFFLEKLGILLGDSSLRNRNNGKAAAGAK